MKILIVEDEMIVAMDLEVKLQDLGYEVVGILDNYEEAANEPNLKKIDLALLDINIHGDKTGIDIARYYRDKFNIPCIFLTAFSSNTIINQAKEVGAYGYVLKPYSIGDLRLVIEIAENKFKQDKEVLDHNKKLERQVLQRTQELERINLQLNQEIEMGKKLQDKIARVEQDEQKRIAKELHDGLSQSLTAVKFTIDAVISRMDEDDEKRQVLENAVQIVQESMRDVRELSHKMTPTLVKEKGLLQAIKSTCGRLDESSVFKVSFLAKESIPELNTLEEMELFRIVQECINNATKHSKGDAIEVSINFIDENVLLKVTDNGIGIKNTGLAFSDGIGLNNIKERSENINAQFSIQNVVPHGTEVTIKLNKS